MTKLLALASGSLAALTLPTQAQASLVLFSITGASTLSFKVDQSPTPDSFTANSFTLNAVPYTLNGNAESANLFFSDPLSISYLFVGNFLFQPSSSLYVSGTTQNPTFLTGSYSLVGLQSGGPVTSYSLSISTVESVPEPATWATMLLGFGAIGLSIRIARRKAKVGSAAV